VLQAAALGVGGEVFVLDMGEPVRILDLARDLIALSGYQEGRDVDIAFTGLRPGEKLSEELFRADEVLTRTVHERIFVGRGTSSAPSGAFQQQVSSLLRKAREGDLAQVQEALASMVPEYHAGTATLACYTEPHSTAPVAGESPVTRPVTP